MDVAKFIQELFFANALLISEIKSALAIQTYYLEILNPNF